MFRVQRFAAIVFVAMAAVLVCLSEGVTAAGTLINTYTGASAPYVSNITPIEKPTSTWGGYHPEAMLDGTGFFGTAPNFTDTDGDTFPDYGTITQVTDPFLAHTFIFLPPSTGEANDKMWVGFTLPDSYDLDSMRLWNVNSVNLGRAGVKDAYIYASNDVAVPSAETVVGGASPGASWTKVSGPGTNGIWEFAEGPSSTLYDGESYDLSGTTARHILIDVESTWEPTGSLFVAMNEVQFFEAVIPEPSSLVMLTAAGLVMLKAGLPAGLLFCGRRRRKRN